jgi:putative hemolysin
MSIWNSLKKIFNLKNNNSSDKESSQNCNGVNSSQEQFSVFDCIVPTTGLCFSSIQSSFEDLINKMEEKKKSYLLIYDQNPDDLVGIVYEKDIITTFKTQEKKDGCDFIFSPITFVPYVMEVTAALKIMHKKNTHLLVVVDNRGSTLGVLTKNSIVDFAYGFDYTKDYFDENIKDGTILLSGSLLLKHIPEDWYIKEFHECYKTGTRTIGGFLGYYSGMVLKVASEVTVNNLHFKILLTKLPLYKSEIGIKSD